MILISYDIADDKRRGKFAKIILKYRDRIQYSVYEIDNSSRILDNIIKDIENKYSKIFGQEDSVLIFNLSKTCEVKRFGYAKNEESDLIIL